MSSASSNPESARGLAACTAGRWGPVLLSDQALLILALSALVKIYRHLLKLCNSAAKIMTDVSLLLFLARANEALHSLF